MLALTAALYFFPRKSNQSENVAEAEEFGVGYDLIIEQAKSQLDASELEIIRSAEDVLSKDTGNVALMDTLARLWDKARFPVVSAHYFEKIANRQPSESNWINAAFRYFDAFKGSSDSMVKAMMVEKSIRAYKKVLEINPDNLNAKTDLGICYAEGTSNPMQGIMMLREVVEKNPDHENAHYNLGILSLKSGQNEKAVERFEKVLKINPSRIEARYLLGRTYFENGNKEKALEVLKDMNKFTSDLEVLREVDKLINHINNQ